MVMPTWMRRLLPSPTKPVSFSLPTGPMPLRSARDTGVATNRYNIFLTDTYNKSDFRQITQLSNMKYGNARYPVQYNTSHFTFVSDETGITNRFAGFFTTRRLAWTVCILWAMKYCATRATWNWILR